MGAETLFKLCMFQATRRQLGSYPEMVFGQVAPPFGLA
jgi:hypothetical protein